MSEAFYAKQEFDEDISCWDTSKVATFFNTGSNFGMFEQTGSFNQPIGCWDVGSATDMRYMFYGALGFNQDLSNWNVAKVTDMTDMFNGAKRFNQSLSKWDPDLGRGRCAGFAGNGAPCGPSCGLPQPLFEICSGGS